MSFCEWCGTEFAQPKRSRGRQRKYCKRSCRQRAYESRRYGIDELWNQMRDEHCDCYLCGKPLDWAGGRDEICLDHKVATVRGGRTSPGNCRPVHVLCNLRKSDNLLHPDFFRQSA